MAPDVNSLPPSSLSSSPSQNRQFSSPPGSDSFRRDTPSPRPVPTSLAAAATLNAADRSVLGDSQGSPQGRRASARRRSNVAMNLQLNDPALPSPGELATSDHRASISSVYRTASPTNIGGTPTIATGDPHHQRAPSLGEMHQELEQEQEAQVNRLLQMIRMQQAQLQQLQLQNQQHTHGATSPLSQNNTHGQQPSSISTAIDDSTPTSERSFSFAGNAPIPPMQTSLPHRSSLSARRTSQSRSPALRPLPYPPSFLSHQSSQQDSAIFSDAPSPSEGPVGTNARRASRDEVAFFQAETATLTRENQMLRHRIKELEKLLAEKERPAESNDGGLSTTTTNGSGSGVSASASASASGGNGTGTGGGVVTENSSPIVPSQLTQVVSREEVEGKEQI